MVIKMFEHVVDSLPEVNKPLSAKYIKSFAYLTFKERIPKIIDSVIKYLNNSAYIRNKCGEDAAVEIDVIRQKLVNLKNSMISDSILGKVDAHGSFAHTASVYNRMIEQRKNENNGHPPTWFQIDWLFAECYLYFKLNEIIVASATLKKYDPFFDLKYESTMASQPAILALSQLSAEFKKRTAINETEKKEFFMFFLKCSLWGNKADLSLSNGKTVSVSSSTYEKIDTMDSCILVNDADNAFKLLQNNNNVVDIILDNAGYELFNDLIFADFLMWSGLAKKIVFHGKNIPWFVSDVTKADFDIMFDILRTKISNEDTVSHVNAWNDYLGSGKWEVKCESFWTYPCDYSLMAAEAPQLYDALGQSHLLVFKGDLNYRKLVGDIYWEPTISFQKALRGFEPTNVLALRTIKADTISGLPEGVFEDLNLKESDWMVVGKYAVIQLLRK